MDRYLRLFENHEDYEDYASGGTMVKPNVSYCEDVKDVHYNPYVREYDKEYLTFVAIEDGTFKFSGNGIYYSLDNGTTWVSLPTNTYTPTVNAGKSILWKGNMQMQPYAGIGIFSSTNKFDVVGNILSLLYGDDFVGQTIIPTAYYSSLNIFKGCTNLVNAENLSLPPTLATYCYSSMFQDCTSLTTTPQLPVTTLADLCYCFMFDGCTSLTTAPELPATTLTKYCYSNMFRGCTSLTSAPELPATTLAESCYYQMFSGCTNLTTAPQLPATTLANSCYYYMFSDCTNLNYIKAMFTTTPSSTQTTNWVNGVAASGTFVKNSAATWTTTGVNGVPNGWTVQYADS